MAHIQVFGQAHHVPQAVWNVLITRQAQSNVILPTLYSCRAREQQGIPTQNHFWLVMTSRRNLNDIRFIVSVTDSILSTYPVFILTTIPDHAQTQQILSPFMKEIAQSLLAAGMPVRRNYSIFGQATVSEAFRDVWTKMTGIPFIPKPYYDSYLSTLTPASFIPYERSYNPAIYQFRPADETDIDQVARLCHGFAQTSDPFTINPTQATAEASYLVRKKFVWVCSRLSSTRGWEIVSLVAYTRNTDVSASITKVFTADSARGKGIAGKLTSKVCHDLFSQGKQEISLFVGVDNPAGFVYGRLGFPHPSNGQTPERWIEYGFDRTQVDLGVW